MANTRPVEVSHTPLLDCLEDALLVLDDQLCVLFANRAAHALGHPRSPTRDLTEIVANGSADGVRELARRATAVGRTRTTIRVTTHAGTRPAEITISNEFATRGVGGLVARIRLLDEAGSVSGDVAWEPTPPAEDTDHLTGLPTRRMVLDRLQAQIDSAVTGSTLAVFFIDLDGFRHINDALGHTAGDAMLKATAAALLEAHPTVEHWGRIGGDEFLLFVPDADDDAVETIGPRLTESARRTVSLGGRAFVSTVSVGVARASIDERCDAYELMQQADIAMHAGKRRLPGLLTRFDPQLRQEVLQRAELESQLRANLLGTGPGFALQPIMNARTRTVFALEALVRFRSSTLGAVRADWCVEIAERSGLIHQLDRHVLRKASQSVESLTDPVDGSPICVSVNCSSTTDVHGADLAARTLDAVRAANLPPERLILEITESAAVAADATLVAELATLRDSGVRIAIDDFGTGHSSLSQLEAMEIDIVKIDRTFMRDVPESPRRLRYLESITSLVSALGPQVVVEGVERLEQITPLMSNEVPLMQGYLFAEPAPANDIRANIERAGAVIDHWTDQSATPFQPVLDWTGESVRAPLPDSLDDPD